MHILSKAMSKVFSPTENWGPLAEKNRTGIYGGTKNDDVMATSDYKEHEKVPVPNGV